MKKNNNDILAIILCGGKGTRLAEETINIPKPLVKIGRKPILTYIIDHYQKFKIKRFILATGYKENLIRSKYKNYKSISCINTGLDTLTGGRIKRLENVITQKTFLMTYGDGLSSVNIRKLIEFHNSHGKIATVTAVRPPSRFGKLFIDKNFVKSFEEKKPMNEGWINGGYFVFNREIFDYIKGDSTILEQSPLSELSKKGQLMAFKHEGFWQCMDTIRDRDFLRNLQKQKKFIFKK